MKNFGLLLCVIILILSGCGKSKVKITVIPGAPAGKAFPNLAKKLSMLPPAVDDSADFCVQKNVYAAILSDPDQPESPILYEVPVSLVAGFEVDGPTNNDDSTIMGYFNNSWGYHTYFSPLEFDLDYGEHLGIGFQGVANMGGDLDSDGYCDVREETVMLDSAWDAISFGGFATSIEADTSKTVFIPMLTAPKIGEITLKTDNGNIIIDNATPPTLASFWARREYVMTWISFPSLNGFETIRDIKVILEPNEDGNGIELSLYHDPGTGLNQSLFPDNSLPSNLTTKSGYLIPRYYPQRLVYRISDSSAFPAPTTTSECYIDIDDENDGTHFRYETPGIDDPGIEVLQVDARTAATCTVVAK